MLIAGEAATKEAVLRTVFKTNLALWLSLIVSGCSIQLPKVESGSLLLDTQAQLLCLNNAAGCRSLSLIVANTDRNLVLRHWQMDPWNWQLLDSGSKLVNLLLTPPNNGYSVTPQEKGRYRLSIHPASLEVWRVLDAEHRRRYPKR